MAADTQLAAAAPQDELVPLQVGAQVWIPAAFNPSARNAKGWAKGTVSRILPGAEGGQRLEVAAEDGWAAAVPLGSCHLVNERDDTLDDLVKSDYLHEAGILQTLRVRYGLDMIYTYSSNILIAVNPHKRLRHLYGSRMRAQYRGKILGELSPHVYAIAEQAFSNMMIDEQRQAILISGESGAGKTESAKMVMQYLAGRAGSKAAAPGAAPDEDEAAQPKNAFARLSDHGDAAPIEEQVLESNPLLEAFGNAKTSRNDNSSRFGKFVELRFDVTGRICGAFIRTYLLERSRVVQVNPLERSYHIFYMLCGGAPPDLIKRLRLEGGVHAFRYLQSEVTTLADVDEAEALRNTLDAMSIVGLNAAEQESVLSIVATVLHLGNVEFAQNNADEAVLASAAAQEELDVAASLLQVAPEALLHALTTRTLEMRGESILKVLDGAAASESRDALAKSLYANLFDWLVAAINRKIPSYGADSTDERVIGILDIYGFESFAVNSFEQLCINLANERLQQHFNQHIFKGEQEEYVREGIKWSYVDFIDNQETLDLLEGGQGAAASLGVFPLIDEANRIARATYQDLAHTIRKRLAERPGFTAPKRPPHSFGVDHYAGQVVYSTEALLDKNKDFVVAEHAALIRNSASPFVRELGAEEPEAAAAPGRRSAFKLNSVGAQFRGQLKGLMATLSACQPHYVRCIKPNPGGVPGQWDAAMVLEQLRAGGVLEAVRIACAGFPTRKAIRPFAQRYKLLLRGAKAGAVIADMSDEEAGEVCRQVLTLAALSGWQIGKTRVFLRAGQLAALEAARSRRVTELITRLQAAWRGLLLRRAYARQKSSAVVIQSAWRAAKARQRAQLVRQENAAVVLQKNWRRRRAVAAYRLAIMHKRATLIQSYVRMHQQRGRFRRETEAGRRAAARAASAARAAAAATVLQAYARRWHARRKAATLRAEARRWRDLQSERDALAAERDMLKAEVGNWRSKRAAESARANESDAANARLIAELDAARLQLQNMVPVAEAREVRHAAEAREAVEAAQAAASAALAAELEVARKGRADAEAREAALQEEVRRLQGQQQAIAGEARNLIAKSRAKEAANAKLWEQVQAAAQEYQREFAAKDAAIQALNSEVEALQDLLHAQLEDARAAARDEVAGLRDAMAQRLLELEAVVEAKVGELSESSSKNVQLGARLVSMSKRSAALEGRLRETSQREGQLRSALQHTASGGLPAAAAHAANGATARTLSADIALTGAGAAPAAVELPPKKSQPLSLLIAGVVQRRLQIVNIVWGARPSDAVGMHVAAWVLGESLMHWAGSWSAPEVTAAAGRVLQEVVSVARRDGLVAQSYWLATTLALGAFLKVRGVGKRGGTAYLFRLGDDLINFGALHKLLAASVPEMMPVVVTELLVDGAQKTDKKREDKRAGESGKEALTFENLMNSPWKGLLGGLSNVIEVMRGEGAPPTAVRAVVAGALCYLDAELLNALVLRRDCCSVSAVKALQAGLAVVKAWLGHIGKTWCGSPADISACLYHTQQAVSYLLQGKDEVARIAERGGEVLPALKAAAPGLTPQQLHKLTEHHHDDWAVGLGGAGGTLPLLRALQAAVEAAPAPGAADDDDQLLLDSQAAFLGGLRSGKLLTEAARHFVQAPRGPGGAPGVSLLQRIDTCCRRMALPRQLRGRPEFEFLL